MVICKCDNKKEAIFCSSCMRDQNKRHYELQIVEIITLIKEDMPFLRGDEIVDKLYDRYFK